MKKPKPTETTQKFYQMILTVWLVFAVLTPATAVKALALKVGIEGGWSMLTTVTNVQDEIINGGGLGGHIQLHLNESWAFFLEGGWTGFPAYQLQLSPGGPLTPSIEHLRLFDGALGVIYKLDVLNITPWFGVGYALLSYNRTILQKDQSFLDTAVRVDLGADYRFVDWFEAGLVLRGDILVTSESPYSTHFNILARATFVWTRQ